MTTYRLIVATITITVVGIFSFAPSVSASEDSNTGSKTYVSVLSAGTEGLWHQVIHQYVDEHGWVDYQSLLDDPVAMKQLNGYLKLIADPDAGTFEGPDADDHRLARLINAYNALTVKLILDHWQDGELTSIRDLADGNPWDHYTFAVFGQEITLNQLEHEWIRGQYAEPRIHWAVVCAAYSCPPLRNEAYTGKTLEAQLHDQERLVLLVNDKRFIDHEGDHVGVTKLFEWYGQDFEPDWQTYLRERLPSEFRSTSFVEYDWKLNELSRRPD